MLLNIKPAVPVLLLIAAIFAACEITNPKIANDAESEVITVAESSRSIPIYGWGEGGDFTQPDADFYAQIPPIRERPTHITDVVTHTVFSKNVGARQSYFSENGSSLSMATLRTSTTAASPMQAPDEYEMNSAKEFRLTSEEEFSVYMMFGGAR